MLKKGFETLLQVGWYEIYKAYAQQWTKFKSQIDNRQIEWFSQEYSQIIVKLDARIISLNNAPNFVTGRISLEVVFPYKMPFEHVRVDGIILQTETREVMASGYIYLDFRQQGLKKGKN